MFTDEQYTCLVNQYIDTVYRIALNYLKNPADAEDVASHIFEVGKSVSFAGYFYIGDHLKEAVLTMYMGDPHADMSELITIPLEDAAPMQSISLADGGIQLSPIGLLIHGDKLNLLNGGWETLVDYVSIRYVDGSEYLVNDDTGDIPVINCADSYMEPGDGYETDRHCVTYLLNRIVALDEVTAVTVDGVTYTID